MFSRLQMIFILTPLLLLGGAAVQAAESGIKRVEIESLSFLNAPKDPVEKREFVFEAEYDRKFESRKRRQGTFSLELHPFVYGTSAKQSRQQQVVFDPRAVYLEFLRSETWLRVGYMTLKWEGTDGLNPMDLASMKDYSDPLIPQTRASGAVAIGQSGQQYDFEVAYIPEQTRSLLPGEKSAWLPRSANFPLRTDEFELKLPQDVSYRYGKRQELNSARENNYASRLQLRSGYGDISLAYYEGLADTPAIEPTLDVVPIQVSPKKIFQLLSPIEITPVDYRVRSVAGFYSRPLGEWIFRTSARYDQPLGSDPKIPSWSQNAIAGIEKSFELGSNTVTALVQGAWVRVPKSSSLLSVRDVFDRTVLFGLRYPMGENWTVMLSGFKATKDSSYYAKADISRRLTDHFKLGVSAEVLDGPSETLLGVYGRNDRVAIALTGVY